MNHHLLPTRVFTRVLPALFLLSGCAGVLISLPPTAPTPAAVALADLTPTLAPTSSPTPTNAYPTTFERSI